MTSLHLPRTCYVDVDDTLVRSFGTKRIPITHVVETVRRLHRQGWTLYCWSQVGQEYAESSAKELGIHECFQGFLTKPNVLLDDVSPSTWCRVLHPNELHSTDVLG